MLFNHQSPVLKRKSYIITLKPTPALSMSKTIFILIAYLTCCVWAWPTAQEQRRMFSGFEDEEPSQPDLQSLNYNPWELAQEPLTYDQSEDYEPQSPLSDIEAQAISNLMEMFDSAPAWGQIVNEKPESELEALKTEERRREAEDRQIAALEPQRQFQFQNDYKYLGNGRQVKRADFQQTNSVPQNPSLSHRQHQAAAAPPQAVEVTTTAVPNTNSKSTTPTFIAPSATSHLHFKGTFGQKEVPLLRPPSKGNKLNIHEPDEPVINVVQRSSAVEKPSAYDTLRKYLTLEDALKKEAEKRQAPTIRLHKRTPNNAKKQIVSDVDSLKGQLSHLKKSV